MGHSKSSSKREVHGDTGLPQEIRKISNKQCIFTAKGTRKRRKMMPKVSTRKKIINIRAGIHEIET